MPRYLAYDIKWDTTPFVGPVIPEMPEYVMVHLGQHESDPLTLEIMVKAQLIGDRRLIPTEFRVLRVPTRSRKS